MSLLLAYHDSKRGLVCSDDRIIRYGAGGAPEALDARVPKFVVSNGLIFATVGYGDICASLNRGFLRICRDYPNMTLANHVGMLVPGLQRIFARRHQDPNRPLGADCLEAAILGYEAGRMRSFVFSSGDDFSPVESTADPNARIFALGHYNPSDVPVLNRLTTRMKLADGKGLPWIAACLRDTMNELHEKYPIQVGQPSFFAAIDAHGVVELPAEFPSAPPYAVEVASSAAHHVTTNKETAFAGTTRFFVGSIMTPKAGGAETLGNNDGGSGATFGNRGVLRFSLVPVWNSSVSQITNPVSISGSGSSISNPQYAVDNDSTTFATITSTGNGTSNSAQLACAQAPGLGVGNYLLIVMNITRDVPTNIINGSGPIVY